MRGTVFSRLRLGTKALLRDQRGNVMFLTAAAILPVIGLLGSGIDIGRAYMAELRLQQACDAGVLAGRRAMSGGIYSAAAQAEANKMFNYNFKSNAYGSNGVTFSSNAQGTSSVTGTASATLPTALMQIFDYEQFDLAVNCTAKLEISNADVMMVLDVTGSMATTNSGDSVNRITALKTATMDFFDTLTTADVGDGRLRFGVVPYSSAANVGHIIYAKNPAWLSNSTRLPSRTAQAPSWINASTVNNGSATNGTAYVAIDWANNGSTVSGKNSTTCPQTTKAATAAAVFGSATLNQTGQTVGDDKRVTTRDSNQPYRYTQYRYVWTTNPNTCREQQRTMEYIRAQAQTVTEDRQQNYIYDDYTYDVSSVKSGTALSTATGDFGAAYSATWGGCLIERKTTAFAANATAPSTALDMDVDTAPTSDDDTKWKLLIPEVSFPRASGPGSTPASTTAAATVSYKNVTKDSSTNGNWQRYSKYWSNGWGVCPAAAMKLTTQTASDRGSFNSYINSLQPVGGTYHDAGMVWGVRLLSADGMFADENATAPNNRPISRHIVFMTDGDMSANMGNLGFQSYEWVAKRVGGTSDADLTTRHNNRFAQLCEKAKAKNITVWVVSFGVSLNTSLTNCATPGKAYQANNAAQLNDNFQAIARQISKLRLSQ
jgi:Flp pilus assembly protein TadG